MAKQRLGILGGTFDPVHRGHFQMGLSVLNAGLLDQLLVMPTGNPPYKTCSASAEDRWKMVVSACSGDHRLIPSRLEIDQADPVFTIDTLLKLREIYPKAELYYIIGADALMKLRKWHRYQDVLSQCTFLVCPRAGSGNPSAFAEEKKALADLGGRFTMVPMEPVTVSSTEVRSALAEGRIPHSLDVSVREYCACKGLYGLPGRLEHIDEWIDGLFDALNPHRFAHSLSVAYTAKRLARNHGIDPLRAEQAGLLHDCAKCMPVKEMQRIATENALTEDPEFLSSGALLHSVVGAWVAKDRYHMEDEQVLEAIACHNTGKPGMSRLSMCVCLADSIEPLRKSYPLLERVRLLSELSLERALLLSLESTADYVRSGGKTLHPQTLQTIQWLKTLPETRSQEKSGARRGAENTSKT